MRRSTSRRPGLTLAKPVALDRAERTTFGLSQKLDWKRRWRRSTTASAGRRQQRPKRLRRTAHDPEEPFVGPNCA